MLLTDGAGARRRMKLAEMGSNGLESRMERGEVRGGGVHSDIVLNT